jgi:hypothetical protein
LALDAIGSPVALRGKCLAKRRKVRGTLKCMVRIHFAVGMVDFLLFSTQIAPGFVVVGVSFVISERFQTNVAL